MPQIPVNSANITTFAWKLTIDVLNRTFTFDTSASVYSAGGINNVKGIAFYLEDQDGVILLNNTFPTTQIPTPATSQVYVFDASNINFAFLFQNYKIIGSIQDNNGTVYSTAAIIASVCQPEGITDQGYVPGIFTVTPDCVNSLIEIKERTRLTYNKQQPLSVTKDGVLSYPSGTIADVDFSVTPFTNNVVYTGQYRIVNTTAATYQFPNDVYIVVSYQTNNVFNVTCKNRIADLICCIEEVQLTAIKNCGNAKGDNALQLIKEISVPFMLGLSKEINGQDAREESEIIRKTLNCNCGKDALTQTEFTPINPAVNTIVLVGAGDTTIPSPTITGNTKTYNIASNAYQVAKGNTGDAAFTIQRVTPAANQVQYLITFNYDIMAGYILNAIAADPTLLAQLNALVSSTGVSLVGLNGGCVIDTTKTTYSLSQNYTISTIISQIVINGNLYNAPNNLFAVNAPAVQNWLNSLSLGIWTVNNAGGVITIVSVNNTNAVSTMTFVNPNVVQQFQNTNVTLVQVLNAIISYLCQLTSLQVALAAAINVDSLDYNGNLVQNTVEGSQNNFNVQAAASINSIINRMITLTGLTCAQLQALFLSYPNVSFNIAADAFLGFMGGNCSQISAQQAALAFIAAVNNFANVKSAWCAINCETPATCPQPSGLNLATVNNTTIGFYGLSWATMPSGNQTVTIQYRQLGSSVWLTASSNASIFPNGNINGTSPINIAGLTPGTTYQIQVVNNCGGAGFVQQYTLQTGAVVSGSYRIDTVLYNTCADSPVTLYSPVPFAPGVIMYTDSGLTTPLTGYTYIAPTTTNMLYNLNSGTGMVGSSTGNMCTGGVSAIYRLANDTTTICGNSNVTLYTNGPFAPGGVLYIDSGLTTPQTGFAYVLNIADGNIYNLNATTGVIGSSTGLGCAPTSHAVGIRMLGSNSYFADKPTTCTNITSFGCGFTIGTVYVKNSDWTNYEAGIPVTAYQDAACTIILQDFSIPANTTKYRVLWDGSGCAPNVWQTDNSNHVSITKVSC